MYSPMSNLQKRGADYSVASLPRSLVQMSLPPMEPLNVNPAGSECNPHIQKVCSFALERQLRCTVEALLRCGTLINTDLT